MMIIIQSISFFVFFTLIFFGIRQIPGMDFETLYLTTEGVGWLYSAIGLIFGVFAAFTIQSQAKKWDELSSSIRQEVNNLRSLFWISFHFPTGKALRLRESIRIYLSLIIHEGWKDVDKGSRSPNMESAVRLLQEGVFILADTNQTFASTTLTLVRNIFESREERLFQSAKRIPLLLKATIYIGALMMVILSYFIGVSNIWIDYIYTASISYLSILIVIVIEDLEHPYRPGNWHITQEAYHELLEEVKQHTG